MKKPVWTTRIQEGDYSRDDLARMLLRASGGSYREAKKALTKADNDPKLKASIPPAAGLKPLASGISSSSDEGIYLAAYAIKKKLKCRDHTALKKLLGGKYRRYYDKLKARDLTLLEQAAQLVQNPPDNS